MTIGILILLPAAVLADPVAVPVPSDGAVRYQYIRDLAWGTNELLTLLLPALFLLLGSRTRVSAYLAKYGKYKTFIVFSAVIFILNSLVQFPFDRIRANALNRAEGSPGTPVMQWAIGHLTQSLPTIAFSILAALFVFWLINRSPRRWWLWTTVVFSVLFAVFLIAEPLTIATKPLGQSPVELKITELADTIGVPPASIMLEDCEPFDQCEIAHVSGLGPTRVILLNKGLFENYPDAWSVQSFAHEAKHFVKDDNLTGWIVMTLLLLVFFGLSELISGVLIKKFSESLGFTSLGQPAALPLIVLILNLLYLAALPPVNMFRQHVEFEADRFGLELTNENEEFARMASSWTTRSKTHVPDPGLFFMLFRSSHPSDAARIAYANERLRANAEPRTK